MKKLTFSTTSCWDNAEGFGCASLGLAGVCDNTSPVVTAFGKSLKGIEITGTYENVFQAVAEAVKTNEIYAAILVFGNVGGENAFLEKLQTVLKCPIVGGGAAIDGATGRTGLIPGNGEAAILLLTDSRYTYHAETKCVHDTILEECTMTLADPRTILAINGIPAPQFLAEKRAQFNLADTDFEHLTFSDLKNVNAHLSMVDGVIKSGRDVDEKMLLRYIPHEKVYESIRSFYDDDDAIVFGCAGLSGILDKPLDTKSLGLFLFGEVCYVDGVSEFGNLMLSKLIITEK